MATNYMRSNNENKILHKELSYKLQGLIFDVRNELGFGHKEIIYQKAAERELPKRNIKFEREPAIKIFSKNGEFLGLYRFDFLIEGKIIIEIKAAQYVTRQEKVRIYDCLRNNQYELAYLINFNSPKLYIKRFLFSNYREKWQKLTKFVAISLLLLFVAIRGISAAELFFESKTQEMRVGQQFSVDLMLDTENKEINAVQGKIIFPGDLLELKEIIDGGSIINLWIDKPRMATNQNTNSNEVTFSGVIPGGFKGILSPYYKGYRPGRILSLIFRTREIDAKQDAKQTRNSLIEIQNPKVLLNDGLGTEAKLSISNFQFRITPEAARIVGILPIKDPNPPEPFELIIAQDPNIFEGKWFLVFISQDKESGIDYYAVHETTRKKDAARIDTKEWLGAKSPYELKDQKLRSYIYVKAVDRAGNERIVFVEPRYPLKRYENYENWVIIILGLIVAYFIRRILWKK